MLRNYLKIAIRNLWRNKSITAIKLAGLIAGFTGVILIVAYVRFELSFDHFNKKASRIYRIEMSDTKSGRKSVYTPVGAGQNMVRDFPEVKNSVIMTEYKTSVRVGEHVFNEKLLAAGPSIFNIFTLPLIHGNPKKALSNPYTAVISQKTAHRLFGDDDPVNKTIILTDTKHPYLITGVMKNIPVNSHFHGDIICSIVQDKWTAAKLNGKGGYGMEPQYVLLSKKADIASLQKKAAIFLKKFNFPSSRQLFLFPLTSIHLHSHLSMELEKNGNISYVYIFGIIALLILGIACVNFINLTTAAYLKRTKEVGVRKVMGASKTQLRMQFLSEGFILFLISILISIFLAWQMAPWFVNTMGISISNHFVINGQTIGWSVFLAVITVVFAAIYPSVFLSNQSPSLVLRSRSSTGHSQTRIRKALVLTQFMISIVLIIATIFIYNQLHFINTKDLGFNEKQVLFFPMHTYYRNIQAFKEDLKESPGVVDLSVDSWNPESGYGGGFTWNDTTGSGVVHDISIVFTDFDFLKTLQIPLVKGRDFSKKYGTDNNANKPVLINQTAAKILRLKDPVGKHLQSRLNGTVMGVVKDFNGLSLYKTVGPIVFSGNESYKFGWLFIRIRPANMATTISQIHKIWKKYYPDKMFNYTFLDQYIHSYYATAARLGKLCMTFTILAFLISCLGLFGLVLFDTEQRTKEIAIRKVFGASVKDILQMINKNFVLLVLIANIIAGPVAWFLVRKWLDNFAYRIDISYLPFIATIVFSLLLTVLTVSIQSWRTARANPVESLRNE